LSGARKVDTARGEVSLQVDGSSDASALVVLAHGAGAGLDSDFMAFMSEALVDRGLQVARFNFAYIEQGRKSPDKNDVLEETFRSVISALAEERAGKKLVLGGKSMGGRIASQVVAAGAEVDGLVFHGYPLHPPGKPERMRDAHLHSIKVPMLFIEGTRDPFCPLETLEKVLAGVDAPSELAVIEDGDHSFKLRKSSGRSTKDAWIEAAEITARFVARV
jgi:predicted alpha/beta-hydrolase family hydrolase